MSNQQELDTLSAQISSIEHKLRYEPLTKAERNTLGLELQPLLKRKIQLERAILLGK